MGVEVAGLPGGAEWKGWCDSDALLRGLSSIGDIAICVEPMPPYWQTFIEQHGLIDKELEIPPQADLSGIGAVLVILDARGIQTEQKELYPGIAVAKDGFIPVASCDIGMGDPYFINEWDGEGGPLYRIYHEEVGEDGYEAERAIVVVLKGYRELLRFVGV